MHYHNMCCVYWPPLKYDKWEISRVFGQALSVLRMMLCNFCCAWVFSAFMVSSLVATSRNSLCVFVTLSCDGSPRAVATVVGCLCELFSKWKPVTLLRECEVSASICLQRWPTMDTMPRCQSRSGAQVHTAKLAWWTPCWTWKKGCSF